MKRAVFVCQQCGSQSPKWLGRCGQCGAWGTLVEEAVGGRATTSVRRAEAPRLLSEVGVTAGVRREIGLGELDRVLGGGLVRGSVVLIGGDPGIGKSTLALQAACALSERGARVLYVAGEESAEQVKLRAMRIGLGAWGAGGAGGATPELGAAAGTPQSTGPGAGRWEPGPWIVAESTLEALLTVVDEMRPETMVIDSVQTLASAELGSAAGSVGQVREVAARLVAACKAGGIAAFLIGHVTKEGFLAGPRVLEHMVDTVLYFEGDRSHAFRILRAVKNRFGSTNEIGVFEMREGGLIGVPNASEIFLAERPAIAPGSAVIATVEGSRPILVEVQALVSAAPFGTPRRTTLGLDANRAALLAAVLEKRMGMRLADRDIFLNVAGGVRVEEPAADLGVVAAIASSYLDRPLGSDVVIVGEVGLTGEVRAIGRAEARVREGAKLGFRRAIVPAANARQSSPEDGLEIVGVRALDELFAAVFGSDVGTRG
jgi:DNA repair protein RadA/Sms